MNTQAMALPKRLRQYPYLSPLERVSETVPRGRRVGGFLAFFDGSYEIVDWPENHILPTWKVSVKPSFYYYYAKSYANSTSDPSYEPSTYPTSPSFWRTST